MCLVFAMQMCSSFLAGDSLRSSRRYHALDETAVFGSACRHEFPLFFVKWRTVSNMLCSVLLKRHWLIAVFTNIQILGSVLSCLNIGDERGRYFI